jgi:23S rRNA pseudouridine2605 synthase
MKGVPLNRALSKLGILSRARAGRAIRDGRVRVDGRVVVDPAATVIPESARIQLDGESSQRAAWRAIIFHKPRGVVTTTRDREGRRTVYDVLGEQGRGLIPVGRLDLASSGLLLMTTDTQLANWITDPAHEVARVYAVSVRGRVTDDGLAKLVDGITHAGEHLRAHQVIARKVSGRESHLIVELREGRNRELRRLFESIGHEVSRLKRVELGGLRLGALEPGEWRDVTQAEIAEAFPGCSARKRRRSRRTRKSGPA